MLISILKKQQRDFKVSKLLDNGLYSKRLRNKIRFYEKNHPGVYKNLCKLNYKLIFKNKGKLR